MNPTVVLADEYDVVRAGLRQWLSDASISVVADATDGVSAIEAVRQFRPDVLLLDVRLPKCDGLECLGRLREEDDPTAVFFYSGLENPTYAARASALGAVGYLLKSSDRHALVSGVKRAAAGESCWEKPVTRRLNGALVTRPADGPPGVSLQAPLTTRESEVLKQLSFGLSNKEIAMALGISYETVKEHVQHILRKLAVSDRTQAAVWAVRHGMA